MNRFVALSMLITMGMMWGLQFSMLKLAASGGYSDISILTCTLSLLSILFAVIVAVRNDWFSINRNLLGFLLIIAVLGYVAPLSAALYAAPHIPAGLLALIACLTPMMTIFIAIGVRTESVSKWRIIGMLLGLSAVFLVLWPQLGLPGRGTSHWIAVSLIVPLSYAVESIFIARFWPKGLNALQAVSGETWIAAMIMIPVYLFSGGPMPLTAGLSNADIAILIFVAAGVIESLLYLYLIQQTGGVFVSFGTFVSLFAGIAWGIILFAESHPSSTWVATLALIIALALFSLDRPVSVTDMDSA